jgi:hypothetical protein
MDVKNLQDTGDIILRNFKQTSKQIDDIFMPAPG